MSHSKELLNKFAEHGLTPHGDLRSASSAMRSGSSPAAWELGVGTSVIAILSHETIASAILGLSFSEKAKETMTLRSPDHWLSLDVVVQSVATMSRGVGHHVANSVHLLLTLINIDEKKCDEGADLLREPVARHRKAAKRSRRIEGFLASLPDGAAKDILLAQAKRPELPIDRIRQELQQYLHCEYYPFGPAKLEQWQRARGPSQVSSDVVSWFAAHACIDLSMGYRAPLEEH